MVKLYLIVTGPTVRRETLSSCIESLPGYRDWFFSMPNSIFVHFSGTAGELYDGITSRLGKNERLFVTEVPLRNAQGWIPSSHWALIGRNRIVHGYQLNFDGYWGDGFEQSLPAASGIYCVYACALNQANHTIALSRLLYVGGAENVRQRLVNHEKKPEWLSCRKPGETICYSVAPVAKRSLSICESALIFKHQPLCNDVGKRSFAHSPTRIVTKGCNALLQKDYTLFVVNGIRK